MLLVFENKQTHKLINKYINKKGEKNSNSINVTYILKQNAEKNVIIELKGLFRFSFKNNFHRILTSLGRGFNKKPKG